MIQRESTSTIFAPNAQRERAKCVSVTKSAECELMIKAVRIAICLSKCCGKRHLISSFRPNAEGITLGHPKRTTVMPLQAFPMRLTLSPLDYALNPVSGIVTEGDRLSVRFLLRKGPESATWQLVPTSCASR